MNQKPQNQSKPVNPYADLAAADCHHWKAMIARVNEPAVAQLLVEFLDSEPELRAKRSGVYLAAHATLDREDQVRKAVQAREEKAAAYGRIVATVVRGAVKVVRLCFALAGTVFKVGSKVASEALQESASRRTSVAHPAPSVEPVANELTFPTTVPFEAQSADVALDVPTTGAKIIEWPPIVWPEGDRANRVATH